MQKILNDIMTTDFPKRYPDLFIKTNNGQTRLAHLVKTRVTRPSFKNNMLNFESIQMRNNFNPSKRKYMKS